MDIDKAETEMENLDVEISKKQTYLSELDIDSESDVPRSLGEIRDQLEAEIEGLSNEEDSLRKDIVREKKAHSKNRVRNKGKPQDIFAL